MLDDEIVFALSQRAERDRTTFEDVVNTVLRMGLALSKPRPQPKPYRLEPSSLGGPVPGVDLDKALQLAEGLEDEGLAHKLRPVK